jgi:DUF4097 and DUF4098 domain-containing protein YvlB
MIRFSAIALVLLAATAASAAERTFERTFKVSPGGVLTVNADSASVHVSAADTNQVTVVMNVRGADEDLAKATFDAAQKDDGVAVLMRMRPKDSWSQHSPITDGHIRVTVPKRYGISVRTDGGSVDLADTVGPARLHTSGGGIVAKNVNGNVEAKTSGGGILADRIRGDVDATASGGDVRLLQIDGKIRGQTSGGSIKCSLVGTNRGISATTSGGSIQLSVPRGTTADIEATMSGGEFSSDLPVVTTERRDEYLKGSINGGGQPIEVRTSGGGISVSAAN